MPADPPAPFDVSRWRATKSRTLNLGADSTGGRNELREFL